MQGFLYILYITVLMQKQLTEEQLLKKSWRNDKLLRCNLLSSDSSDGETTNSNKKNIKKSKKRYNSFYDITIIKVWIMFQL